MNTIDHEQLPYISVKPLIPFFNQFGMEVFDVEASIIHGGATSVYVGNSA